MDVGFWCRLQLPRCITGSAVTTDLITRAVRGLRQPRRVHVEELDHLSPEDPAAKRSRRDLLRVHRAMGTVGIIARGCRQLLSTLPDNGTSSLIKPLRILELGAGDGRLMLRVAQVLGKSFGEVELVLLDRQDIVTDETMDAYAALGWRASTHVVDVRDWAANVAHCEQHDLLITTLFLHHFEGAELDALLHAMALTSTRTFACEPRRGFIAQTGSRLIGLIGANSVTRNDAVLSVQAGFRDNEISARWPRETGNWLLIERAAGLFSHVFCATLTEAR